MSPVQTRFQPPPARQDGIVLVVGLVFLLVLTILGVTSLRTTTLQQRMAGNLQQRTVAFQDAESRIAAFYNAVISGATLLSTNDTCSSIDTDEEPATVNPQAIESAYTCPEHIGNTPAQAADTAFGGDTSFQHFRIESQSVTRGNARVTVQQGFYKLSPGQDQDYLEEQ